jgi:hypothetical protein
MHWMLLGLGLGLGLLVGCGADEDDDSADDDDVTADDDDATAGDDDDATPGDDDDATPGDDDDTVSFDCDALPAGPLPYATLTDLYASEDFCFDDAGHLISHDMNALFKQEYPPGAATPFAITDGGPGGPASMRMLATGDLVYANVDTSTLYRVDPDGNTTVVYGALGYPTGIDIHPDGTVFLADLMGIMRLDPYGKTMEILIESGVLSMPNGMTFSDDYSAVYVGTMNGIYAVPVAADGTPTGPPEPWAESPGGGELLGMGVDRCGNVYALHEGRRLLRYPIDGGEPETLMDLQAYGWMTNLQWGSGLGSWSPTAIYITDRNADAPVYYEVDVGVPSKQY